MTGSRFAKSLVLLLLGTLSLWLVAQEKAPERKPEIEFEYVIDGEKKKGKCEVMVLDLADGVKMELVKIKKGKFMMGSPKEEDSHQRDEDLKEIEIKADFWMGRYEVTQAQYKVFMKLSELGIKEDKRPAEPVSWNNATKFCEKMSEKVKKKITLPTEAQWEYACRAGTKTPFHFGSVLNGDLANCNGRLYPYGTKLKGKDREMPIEVGSYPANPWGLSDMHGNVWEWCLDWNDSDKNDKVLRGGAYNEYAGACRSASRNRFEPSSNFFGLGFRVICAVE